MRRSLPFALAAALLLPVSSTAQVGSAPGFLDPNLATAEQLKTVPNLTDALIKSVIDKRPFLKMTELNAVLSPALDSAKLRQVYGKLWLHINLNSASKEEILLIPGVGARMLREFEEYRPYANMAQFNREIGKYVKADELARLGSYVFVALDLNSASDADLLTIPGLGPRMLREFKEYRPYKDFEQFRREMGKYVNKAEVARLERYVLIK